MLSVSFAAFFTESVIQEQSIYLWGYRVGVGLAPTLILNDSGNHKDCPYGTVLTDFYTWGSAPISRDSASFHSFSIE